MKAIGLLETLRVDFRDGRDGMTARNKKDAIEGSIIVIFPILLLYLPLFACSELGFARICGRISFFLAGYFCLYLVSIYIKVVLHKKSDPTYNILHDEDESVDQWSIRWFLPIALIGWLIINTALIFGQSIFWFFKNFWHVMLFLFMLFLSFFGLWLILKALL